MTLAVLAQRLKEERQRVGMDQREMAAAGGVSRNSQLAYEAGRTAPSSDYLLAVQDAGIDVAYLFTGLRQHARSSNLGLADESDWIMVPTFSLVALSGEQRGEPSRTTPMRRDWLTNTIGTISDLWLTTLPCDYPPIGLREDAKVLCQDIRTGSLHERHLCIWRQLELGTFIVGRFSAVRSDAIHVADDGEYWIGRAALADDDPTLVPIGRILGRPIAQIR